MKMQHEIPEAVRKARSSFRRRREQGLDNGLRRYDHLLSYKL